MNLGALRTPLLLKLFTLAGIFIISSCEKGPQPLISQVEPVIQSAGSKQGDPNLITVEVNFNSSVSNASSSFAPLKYNKTSVINFEFDDNPSAAFDVYEYLNTQTFSDGTGKQIKPTAACAVNSRGSYNNGDLWENYQGNLTKDQAIKMVSGGWTLENHGFYHSVLNPASNFGYGKPIAENISDNTKYVFDKTGFKMRTLVVPSDDKGYLSPAFDQGLIATTSTNSFEGFVSFPLYGDYVDISTLPTSKVHLRRDFNDRWDISGVNSIKSKITTLFSKSTEKERMLYRLGTHMPNVETFKLLSEHIKSISKDNCWVTTMQEMVEYLQLKEKVVKTELIVNGKLIISLDISKVDKQTFFKDITLMVTSNSGIQSIKVNNAKENNSNNSNGLINISF